VGQDNVALAGPGGLLGSITSVLNKAKRSRSGGQGDVARTRPRPMRPNHSEEPAVGLDRSRCNMGRWPSRGELRWDVRLQPVGLSGLE
jgi:hypothetical protein